MPVPHLEGPRKILSAGGQVIVFPPRRARREGGKPGDKEGKSDGGVRGEGQSPAGGDELGDALGALHPSPQAGDHAACGALRRRQGQGRCVPNPSPPLLS